MDKLNFVNLNYLYEFHKTVFFKIENIKDYIRDPKDLYDKYVYAIYTSTLPHEIQYFGDLLSEIKLTGNKPSELSFSIYNKYSNLKEEILTIKDNDIVMDNYFPIISKNINYFRLYESGDSIVIDTKDSGTFITVKFLYIPRNLLKKYYDTRETKLLKYSSL